MAGFAGRALPHVLVRTAQSQRPAWLGPPPRTDTPPTSRPEGPVFSATAGTRLFIERATDLTEVLIAGRANWVPGLQFLRAENFPVGQDEHPGRSSQEGDGNGACEELSAGKNETFSVFQSHG